VKDKEFRNTPIQRS